MLNACPQCHRLYPADAGAFCQADGTRLVPSSELPPKANPDDPVIGHSIAGKYEVRRVVADGGMGRVYEARAVGDERRVAVKLLHADIADDEVNIERFRREANTSRELGHANVVEVIDFAETAGIPGRRVAAWYLAMEYLDGEELRAVLKRDIYLPLPRVIRVVSQLAEALDSAHARGFVHRDIKPDNVFLVRSGEGDVVKLLDFGSVKFTRGQDRGNKLTVMGTTIGSPFYMSPEQAHGSADLDHRADVWAVGVIVYEAMVGKVPFTAPNGPQILFKIVGDNPEPPSFANDKCPPELDAFMFKALQKKPAERYQSVGELADALGHTFGLSGDHHAWARAAESALQTQLDDARKAPSVPAPPPAPEAPLAQAELAPPPPAPEAPLTPPVAVAAPAKTSLPSVMVVPTTKTPAWVYPAAAVGVAALAGLVYALSR